MKTLIIGSDGNIGAALFQSLKNSGDQVIGTTRRKDKVGGGVIWLDLLEPERWEIPEDVDAALICAGVSGLETCAKEPEKTASVNVDAAGLLAKRLAGRGVFTVYISSSQVFDGSIPFPSPDDSVCPVNEYGRQRARAESLIGATDGPVGIVRFTKILEPGFKLIIEWTDAFKQGKAVHPFSDMPQAPIPIWFAVKVLRRIIKRRLEGIIHVSADTDISFAQIALAGARILGISESLVQPVEAMRSGKIKEPFPERAALNIDRMKYELGLYPPDLIETVEKAFVEEKRRSGAWQAARRKQASSKEMVDKK